MAENLSVDINLFPAHKFRLAAAYDQIAAVYTEAGFAVPANIARLRAEWFRKEMNEPLAPGALRE